MVRGDALVLSSIGDQYSMKSESRNVRLLWMATNTTPGWTFLTNHAQVLVCIAHDPGVRLRDIGEGVGITERAAHRIVTELADAGYITRERNGRRNTYTINAESPIPDPIARGQNVGELLEILTATHESNRRARSGTSA
jgi:MarR family protein